VSNSCEFVKKSWITLVYYIMFVATLFKYLLMWYRKLK